MFLKIYFSVLVILMLILSITFVLCSGCSNLGTTPSESSPVVNYKTFQLELNDIRLQFMKYPLFSFEYPEIFRLVDLNLIYQQEHAITMHSGLSDVMFTVKQTDLPEPILLIRVQKSGFMGQNDANAVLKWCISTAESDGDIITTSKRTVYGIQADYLETFGNKIGLKIDGTPIYPDHQGSLRGVFFDYAGLVWSITITWDYLDFEPQEVQGYFEHVIETFKFLD